MSDLTIEQLEALKEGTTPGTWCATDEAGGSDLIIDETGESLLSVGSIAEVWASFSRNADGKIAAAAPALVEALIEEKKAHAELRAWAENLHSRVGSVVGGAVTFHKEIFLWELTRILEGDDD